MQPWEVAYQTDFASQDHSGPIFFTEQQQKKNLQLRDNVRDILPVDDDQKMSDCDLLYRFLIGRHWNIDSAELFLRKYVELRQNSHLNRILTEEMDPRVEACLSPIYGVDKEGLPILWMTPDPAKLIPTLEAFPKETLVRGQLQVMERARFIAKHLGVDRCTYVCNLGQITMSSVTRSTLDFLRSLMKILQEYYPEIMRWLLIYNTGWAVSATWKVLRPFVDARVQDKIRFSNAAPSVESLKKFIAADNVLGIFGGTGTEDALAKILAAEVARLHVVAASGRGPALASPDSDTDEVLYSFCTTPTSARSPLNERLIIGNHGVLSQMTGTLPNEQITFFGNARSEVSESADNESNNSTGGPSSGLAPPPAELVMSMTHRADGYITGYVQHRPVAEVSGNLVHALQCPVDYLGGDREDQHALWERVLVGEYQVEFGHLVHQYVMICDMARTAKFVIRKDVWCRRLTIFRVVGDGTVITDKHMRHYSSGRRSKWAVAVPHKTASATDGGAWMLHTSSDFYANPNACPRQPTPPASSQSTTPSRVAPANGKKLLLAECRGQSVRFFGDFAAWPPVELFMLVTAVTLLWEDTK